MKTPHQFSEIVLLGGAPDEPNWIKTCLIEDFPAIQIKQILDALTFAQILSRREQPLVLTTANPGWATGQAVVRAVKKRYPNSPVIMLAEDEQISIVREAIRAGVDDYVIASRTNPLRLRTAIHMALKRQAQRQALEEAEQRYHSLFNEIPAGLYITQPDGTIIDANPALVQMLRFPNRKTLLQKNTNDLYLNRSDRVAFQKLIDTRGHVHKLEVTLRCFTGKKITVQITANAVRNENHQITYYRGTMEDITRSKLAEKEREQLFQAEQTQRALAETLGRVSMILSAVLDLSTVLDLICRESANLFGVEAAYVWLVKDDRLVSFAGHGSARDKLIGHEISLTDAVNLGSQVIAQREPIVLNDVQEAREIRTGVSGIYQVRSILAAPLIKGANVIGVLFIIDPHRIDRFSQQDIEIALQLGSHAANAVENARLYEDLQKANDELEAAYDTTLEGWSHALELRDDETEGHSQRVTGMTMRLARAFSINSGTLAHIRRGALLHDIGKVGIPDSILYKPGPLNENEWEIMRQHPVYAYNLLSPIEYLRPALDIPYCHHERWDGSGYPRGLKGKEIPLSARIFAVVDVWDALNSDRPYRTAWSPEKITSYLQAEAGKTLDLEVIEVFLDMIATQSADSMGR